MENIDSSKFHTLNMKYKKFYIALGFVLLLVVLPALTYTYYNIALNRPAQGFKEAQFQIEEGEAISSIASRLHAQGLVNSDFLFKVHLFSQGLHTKIQAGVYNIPAGASVAELALIFQHGTNDASITFIEGWRVEEYALAASEQFENVDYNEFLTLAKDKEGFLFPDTYFFNADVDEEEIVELLGITFEEKTAGILAPRALEAAGLTKTEAIIFASIVEREVSDEEDRPVVAGILIKRWKNDELLGADATTQYAVAALQVCAPADGMEVELWTLEDCWPAEEDAKLVNWWPRELTAGDLAYDSPYNTRVHAGLPPTPISNPGAQAIEAVLNYTDTPYNYYLTDKNGITHYATTLEEHNKNVSEKL
ncbi:hypothetical protein A2886_03435 [candidate division WWE3 bacterium RIFCSPHIGHO2_01_FULL_42_13]|uniref:Endolytic murein transglycosylase n=1 Tax=candidate division WWE3 bacterium RIFCSPHIGHO2_01_FULL_42_13 TaxID=1802617 RepID=A0A1F4URL6_UNCKA|nr:MAG: hypothetical protein A2886_03435 [candidate division WWE3 bacterium RIFCSPHIGHO2_01_FULL_42_13]